MYSNALLISKQYSIRLKFMNMELLLLFICLLPILYFLAINFLPRNATNRPPGSTGWPLLGETVELGMLGGKGIPEKFFEKRMKKYSPEVFKTSILGETTAVFCGALGNKFLFSNENKLVSISWPRTIRKILPHSEKFTLVSEIAQESTKVRNILIDFLKPHRLQNCVGVVDAVAKKHFNFKWDSQEQVTVLPLVKEYTFAVACKFFLSIDDPKTIEEFAKPFHVLAAGIFGIPVNIPGTSFNKGIKASNLVREILYGIIRERKAHVMAGKSPWSHDILWNMIMMGEDDGGVLSELEIADHLLVFFLASQDSTSTTITFLIKYLAEYHQVHEEVIKEQRCITEDKQAQLKWEDLVKMKYSWNVASEVMRLIPPVQGNFREALADFTYSGFSIPKGWKLYWTPNTTHKNPDYFPDPENFDPSRFEGTGPAAYSYVPFGGGSRICPGKEFARIVILAFLHNLVQRFRWEKLLSREKIVIQPVPTPDKGLPIRLYPL